MQAMLAREDLGALLETVAAGAELYVPLADDGGGRFVAWSSPEREAASIPADLRLGGVGTARPGKEVLFAQTASLFHFQLERGDFQLEASDGDGPQRVVFGLRPCDGHAFAVLDRALLRHDYREPLYDEARREALLVGVGCARPGPACFCTSMGGDPHDGVGLDVLLTEIDAGYLLVGLSEPGDAWLGELRATATSVLREASDDDRAAAKGRRDQARQRVPRSVDRAPLHDILERSFDAEMWQDLAPACLGCGVCTFLCPSCRCFDIQDEVRDTGGRRLRVWDSCLFPEYSQEASGHNPRPRLAQRWRNRFYDKLHWGGDGRGNPACVGCGRCIEHCPAGIDLVQLIGKVVAMGRKEATT